MRENSRNMSASKAAARTYSTPSINSSNRHYNNNTTNSSNAHYGKPKSKYKGTSRPPSGKSGAGAKRTGTFAKPAAAGPKSSTRTVSRTRSGASVERGGKPVTKSTTAKGLTRRINKMQDKNAAGAKKYGSGSGGKKVSAAVKAKRVAARQEERKQVRTQARKDYKKGIFNAPSSTTGKSTGDTKSGGGAKHAQRFRKIQQLKKQRAYIRTQSKMASKETKPAASGSTRKPQSAPGGDRRGVTKNQAPRTNTAKASPSSVASRRKAGEAARNAQSTAAKARSIAGQKYINAHQNRVLGRGK